MAERKKAVETRLTVQEAPGGVAQQSAKRKKRKQRIKPVTVEKSNTESLQQSNEQTDLFEQGRTMGQAQVAPLRHGFDAGVSEAMTGFSAHVASTTASINGTISDYLESNFSNYLTGSDDDGEIV